MLKTGLVGAVLGFLVAATVGGLDALLNASGKERTARIFICGGIGLLGGLLGGLVGQALTNVVIRFLPILEIVSRTLGWILVGVVIGASIGVFDLMRARQAKDASEAPRKKVKNGILGGLVGGLIGGLISGVAPMLIRALPNTAAAIGFLALGSSIGLLIGLAQVFLKEAWLKVESGFRAGREMILSKDETTIGRAESCDLGLFGDNSIERLHARIRLKANRYFVEDAGSQAGTYLNDQRVKQAQPLKDGDAIRIGNSVLRFGERAKK
jgi:predicted membrane-bound spermidine synthase